jgi:hypothetical protein
VNAYSYCSKWGQNLLSKLLIRSVEALIATASQVDSYRSLCVTRYKEESRFDITSRCAAAAVATVFCYRSKIELFYPILVSVVDAKNAVSLSIPINR